LPALLLREGIDVKREMSAIDAHFLLAEITSGDRDRRLKACNVISDFDHNSDVDVSVFVSSLTSSNDDVIFWSEIALQHLGERGKDAIPALMLLLEHSQLFVRQYAVKTLAAVGPKDKRARGAFFGSFSHPEAFIRGEAVEACIGLPDFTLEELKAIAAMASDPDEHVSRQSEITLRNIRIDSPNPSEELCRLELEADRTRVSLHGGRSLHGDD
jgi:HEAT repeat protein